MNYRGNYGTQGVGAVSNYPGARADASAWVDAAGNFWLFAGDGWDSADQFGVLNDLWEYNPTTNVWTWVSGSGSLNSAGICGTRGVPAATNMPGSRIDAATWIDTSGNVWLFGGAGLDGAGAPGGQIRPSAALLGQNLTARLLASFRMTGFGGFLESTRRDLDPLPPARFRTTVADDASVTQV